MPSVLHPTNTRPPTPQEQPQPPPLRRHAGLPPLPHGSGGPPVGQRRAGVMAYGVRGRRHLPAHAVQACSDRTPVSLCPLDHLSCHFCRTQNAASPMAQCTSHDVPRANCIFCMPSIVPVADAFYIPSAYGLSTGGCAFRECMHHCAIFAM